MSGADVRGRDKLPQLKKPIQIDLILKNLELHLSVIIRHVKTNSILGNTISEAIIILLFLRYEEFFPII